MPGSCGSGTQRRGCGEERLAGPERKRHEYALCNEYGAVTTRIPGSSGHHSGREKVKIKDYIEMIETDGWYLVATRGSYRQ